MEKDFKVMGPTTETEEATRLSNRAFRILEGKLKAYGSSPGDSQLQALRQLLGFYSEMAHGRLRGRYAFPFPCGTGKTQSIVAFAQALAELEGESNCYDHISMAISASKVEALCDIKRDLIRSGVPEGWIGLYHSYKYDSGLTETFLNGEGTLKDGFASEPPDIGLETKRILLCTHNRVRNTGNLDSFNIFRGAPRSLLIYDESLFKSEARVIRIYDLQAAHGHFNAYPQSESGEAALKYIRKALDAIEEELHEQEHYHRRPRPIDLPEIDDQSLQEYKAAFSSGYENIPAIRSFLAMAGNPIRVISTHQGGGVINYEVVVSPDLENIVILDASHNIRDLVRYDKSITRVSKSKTAWISYRNLSVHQMFQPGGRHSIESAFRLEKTKPRLFTLEIYEVVKRIPENEGVLFFVFKKRKGGVDFEEALRKDLENHGIDMDAEVEVKEVHDKESVITYKKRFNFLTWGNETSLSSFSFCRNVICVGVLHRSHVELGGYIVGQSDSLLAEVNKKEIQEVVKGEVNHCLYQALSRGSIRKICGYETEPMNAWIIDKLNNVPERLKDVLPDAQWEKWRPEHMVTNNGRIQRLVDSILEYLEELNEETVKISTHELKKQLSLKDEPKMTVTEAVRSIDKRLDVSWNLEGRSLVRFRPFAIVPG